MLKKIFKWFQREPEAQIDQNHPFEGMLMTLGRAMSNDVKKIENIKSIQEVEFKIFSQWGDDGIIQWLIHNLKIPNDIFIEFGVSDYRESNTRFLLMNNNWSGLVMDGSKENIRKITESEYYWMYDLQAKTAFIDKENINSLLETYIDDPQIGLLHIDLDGNDYWIWQELNVVNPDILILEYNSILGSKRAISVPYHPEFNRTEAHYSNLYFGASLMALVEVSKKKGYAFIGCNSAGNNAFFVRRELLNDLVKEKSVEEGFVMSKARESRDEAGNLTFISGSKRVELIRGLPVINTLTDLVESL